MLKEHSEVQGIERRAARSNNVAKSAGYGIVWLDRLFPLINTWC